MAKECHVSCELMQNKDGKVVYAYTGLAKSCEEAYRQCESKSIKPGAERGKCGCVSVELDVKRGISSILVENEEPYQTKRFFLGR